MTLTKSRIAETIQERIGFTQRQSTETLETLLKIFKRTLSQGEDVLVSGFGRFQVKSKGKRRGRNPATGKSMILDARKVVSFKCSGKLRKKINQN
jgi:integration host factor subunit alpha